MTEPTTRCVIRCGREAEHGYLCTDHYTRLSSMLRDVEDEAVMLRTVPSMQQRTGGGGSLPSERAPARLTAIAFRDRRTKRWEPDTEPKYVPPPPKAIGPWCLFCEHDTCVAWRAGRRRDLHDDEHDAGSAVLASILGELHNWARLVREERELSTPDRITVTGERDTLSRHLLWISEQPWVDECFKDIGVLLGQLRRINNTRNDPPEGECFLMTDTGPCGGTIWRRPQVQMTWRVKTDRCERENVEVADGAAFCEQCGASWEGADLARLNLILEQAKAELKRPRTEDGRRMLTAQEMAAKLGVKIGNLRVIAHRCGAVAVNGHYDPDDFRERMSA